MAKKQTPEQEKPHNKIFKTFQDIENYVTFYKQSTHAYLDEMNKAYYMCTSERAQQLRDEEAEWRSNVRTPLTYAFVNRIGDMLLEMDKNFSVVDLKADIRGEEMSKTIIDHINYISDRALRESVETMEDVICEGTKDGWAYMKIELEKEVCERKYIDAKGKEQKITYKHTRPVFNRVSSYNVFSDPKGRFVIERAIMTADQIQKRYEVKVPAKASKEDESKIVFKEDFDAIKKNIVFNDYFDNRYGMSTDQKNVMHADDQFDIKDGERLKEVFRIHDKYGFDLYINGKFYKYVDNQSITEDYPWFTWTFRRIPGSDKGTGIAHVVSPIHQSYDKVLNCRNDNVLLSVNKIFKGSETSNLDESDKVDLFPGKIIRQEATALNLGDVPASAYDEGTALFGLLQAATGLSGNSLGLQDKVERVAAGPEMLKKAAEDQLNRAITATAQMYAWMAKYYLLYFLAFTPREEILKILPEDSPLLDMDLNDLANDFEFSFSLEGQTKKYNAVRSQILINFLNTLGQFRDEQGRPVIDVRDVVGEIAKSEGVPTEALLTEEDYQQIAQAVPGAAGEGEITNLQKLGAGPMGPFASNPTGVN